MIYMENQYLQDLSVEEFLPCIDLNGAKEEEVLDKLREIVNEPGVVNLDYADLKAFFHAPCSYVTFSYSAAEGKEANAARLFL